eukprot:GILK01005817.1.p1 GENE.GILK01005817.1~~GILK01005817.1.p1  ORF type:complete len:394 (-),score=72.09 GILK01005817.1:92-1213(-)
MRKTVVIDLESVLLDFEALVVAACRAFVSNYGRKLDSAHKPTFLDNSLEKAAAEICSSTLGQVVEGEAVLETVSEYVGSVKPRIGAVSTIQHLRRCGYQVIAKSKINCRWLEVARSVHKEWLPPIQAWSIHDSSPSDLILLEGNPALAKQASEAGYTVVTVRVAGMPEDCYTSCTNFVSSLDTIQWSSFDVPPLVWPTPKSIPLDLATESTAPELVHWESAVRLNSPVRLQGTVVPGYGRGSKMLGVPTANLSMSPEVREKLATVLPGVYFGWGSIGTDSSGVYKMVLSVGWNPFFDNPEKTLEAYLMHEFSDDFHHSHIRLLLLSFLRAEASFASLDHLVEAIHMDTTVSRRLLDETELARFAHDDFFSLNQ